MKKFLLSILAVSLISFTVSAMAMTRLKVYPLKFETYQNGNLVRVKMQKDTKSRMRFEKKGEKSYLIINDVTAIGTVTFKGELTRIGPFHYQFTDDALENFKIYLENTLRLALHTDPEVLYHPDFKGDFYTKNVRNVLFMPIDGDINIPLYQMIY